MSVPLDFPLRGEGYLQLVLPAVLKEEVLTQLHQGHGHQGVECTTELVRQYCNWPGMFADVKQWVQSCELCQVTKDPGSVSPSVMDHLLAAQPNEVVTIDFTILEPSQNGLESVLVITDVFSKYTVADPNATTAGTNSDSSFVTECFFKYGVPSRVHSDQDCSFESCLIQQFCHLYEVEKSRTTPYHWQWAM